MTVTIVVRQSTGHLHGAYAVAASPLGVESRIEVAERIEATVRAAMPADWSVVHCGYDNAAEFAAWWSAPVPVVALSDIV